MKVPQYQDAEKAIRDPDTNETPLDVFVYECSPADYHDQTIFRWRLQELLDSITED